MDRVSRDERAERREDADVMSALFLAKWGTSEPPPAYREAWEHDLETVQWMNQLARFGAR